MTSVNRFVSKIEIINFVLFVLKFATIEVIDNCIKNSLFPISTFLSILTHLFTLEPTEDVICGMEELSRMCSFLDDGRVLNTTLTSDKWTVFAPTDEAFENAFESIAGLTDDSILDIMKYHTVPGDELKKDDLICETNLIMGNDRASQTTCSTHSGFMYQRGPGNITPRTPRLIAPDNLACNGVVHIVSQILLPEEV